MIRSSYANNKKFVHFTVHKMTSYTLIEHTLEESR